MDAFSGTPPTPPYSIPHSAAATAPSVAPLPNGANPSDAGNPMLHTSTAAAQVPAAQAPGKARAPPRRKVPASKRPPTAAGAGGPATKRVKTSAPRRAQAPPPPPPMNTPPPAPPSADPSGAHMVFDEVPER
jgi:hypothetical protein